MGRVHVDILRRPLSTYVVIAAVLGVAALVLTLTKVTGLSLVLDVLAAATAFVAGFAARSRARHPAWAGAAAGAAFGIVNGIAAFLHKTTASELRTALQKSGRSSPLSTHQLLVIVNSPGAHLGSLAVSAILFALVGLILGAIAGALAGGREQQRRAV